MYCVFIILLCDKNIVQLLFTVSSFLHSMITHNVDYSLFESYSISDDENNIKQFVFHL